MLALAAIVGWQTTLIPSEAVYAKVGPTIIPWIVTGLLAVMGLALLVHALRGGWMDESEHGDFDWPSIGWLVAGLVLNVGLIDVAGFILASTILFTCTARAFGSTQYVRNAAIGFALALVSYVGFDRVLGYKIGSGLIEGLF